MKYIISIFILLSALDAYATKCIGYYTSNNLITSSFGNVGDQFSNTNIKGGLSWTSGHTSAHYKSSIRHNNGMTYNNAICETTYLSNLYQIAQNIARGYRGY
jgi:hypothetical protein